MTDQDIIRAFKKPGGEEKAFEAILQLYQERLYWHIRRLILNHDDSDDVLQNTFIKIWKGLPNFRSESGLYTWLYRIATNEALSFLKQKQNRTNNQVDDPDGHVVNRLSADPYFDGDEIQKKLFAVMEILPAKQRLVFQMKYFDDMKYQDISAVLDTSVGALKASYHHAVKKIEEAFKND